jgi:hypothetical protein
LYNQKEILAELVKPKITGGYGLSPLKERNKGGQSVTLMAIRCGHENLLADLVRPVEKDGYGLGWGSFDDRDSYGFGPVLTAIRYNKLRILRLLLKPISEGGYGLKLDVTNSKGVAMLSN